MAIPNPKNYPYSKLTLTDLPGEVWEDVPGFIGEYEVSNYGRIKSLRRWRANGRNSGYYTEERIREQIMPYKKVARPAQRILPLVLH